MDKSGKDTKQIRRRYHELENIMKGVANHRRIEVLFLLKKYPALSTDDIVQQLDINYQTGAVHVRRLVLAGLIIAYRQGKVVLHDISPLGHIVISLLIKL